MINFGKYDQKVTFINFQSVSDGAGGTTLTPLISLITFASIKQTKGTDGLESGQMVLPNTYEVRIQFRTSFIPDIYFQILYRSKYHKIIGIKLDEMRQRKEYVITMIGI
jgi:head-tail adaptor